MCNSFVAGDLTIDHTIYVEDTTDSHQPRNGERVFQVIKRTDTAGGAANSARILAILSQGETHLWGITGQSHWGPFRMILERSQAIDGAFGMIKFRGILDETAARMNTINRLILRRSDGKGVFEFRDRFDETRHLHVPPDKRNTVLYYLERAHSKLQEHNAKLDVIILNDFDLGCLNQKLVSDIARFARNNNILLFVQPKYEVEKYRDIEGTAVFPNLLEWCRLTKQESHLADWQSAVKKGGKDLAKMAHHSFRHFGSFDFYGVRCGEDGIIFIARAFEKRNRYDVWKIPPHLAAHPKDHQIGLGDVLTASFAMELAKGLDSSQSPSARSRSALTALIRANVVVATYREMLWHRMPSKPSVTSALDKLTDDSFDPSSQSFPGHLCDTVTTGVMYLPKTKDETVALSEYKTSVPGWYSGNTQFVRQIEEFRNDCLTSDGKKHIVLGSHSGSGKSKLVGMVLEDAERAGIFTQFLKPEDQPINRDERQLQDVLDDVIGKKGNQQTAILAVDEALGAGFDDRHFCLRMFQKASANSVRLLLLDSGYFLNTPIVDQGTWSDIYRRCNQHILLALNERPFDIPLTIASMIAQSKGTGTTRIEIQGGFLLSFIEAFLEVPSISRWEDPLNKALKQAHWNPVGGQSFRVPDGFIPTETKKFLSDSSTRVVQNLWFKFDQNL